MNDPGDIMKKNLLLVYLCLFTCHVSAQTLTLEERLTRLEDVEAIRTLITSYGRYVDERNWEAFIELFAEDNGTWNGGMGIAEGRDAIYEMMESSMGRENTGATGSGHSNLHLVSNEFIDVEGETATALSKWVFVMTSEEGDPDVAFVGHYQDDLVKEDGTWRFQYRQVFSDIMSPNVNLE